MTGGHSSVWQGDAHCTVGACAPPGPRPGAPARPQMPAGAARGSPVAASHTHTDASMETVVSSEPSAENCRPVMSAPWNCGRRRGAAAAVAGSGEAAQGSGRGRQEEGNTTGHQRSWQGLARAPQHLGAAPSRPSLYLPPPLPLPHLPRGPCRSVFNIQHQHRCIGKGHSHLPAIRRQRHQLRREGRQAGRAAGVGCVEEPLHTACGHGALGAAPAGQLPQGRGGHAQRDMALQARGAASTRERKRVRPPAACRAA